MRERKFKKFMGKIANGIGSFLGFCRENSSFIGLCAAGLAAGATVGTAVIKHNEYKDHVNCALTDNEGNTRFVEVPCKDVPYSRLN